MKTIIDMASEVGMLIQKDSAWGVIITAEPSELKAFADLIRADEREACAKVCEQHGYEHYCGNVTDKLAETIRARGQA